MSERVADEGLAQAIDRLKNDLNPLSRVLRRLDHDVSTDCSELRLRLHYPAIRQARPMAETMIEAMAIYIAHYCLPRREIDAVYAKSDQLSIFEFHAEMSRLDAEARRLFQKVRSNPDRTGEAGELILYLLTEWILEAPQVIAKMSLKMNPNVPAHGADGIHARFDRESGKLLVYSGEAKLHKQVHSAIASAVDSISNAFDYDAHTHELKLVELYLAEKDTAPTLIASRELNRRMSTIAEMLVVSACAFGIGAANIVYANGAAQAEEIAIKIAERLADRKTTREQEALAQLAVEAVHSSYALAQCVRKGVGFHYSDIPTHVRQAVEKAVADGVLDYLVCTSTLLQGVNLPAKNLFMCRPEKGNRVPLESVDFWNLAGRAGRLLKEFQGNIFLIQYEKWERQPLRQPRQVEIAPAIEVGITDRPQALLRAIEQPGIRDDDLEAMFVRLLDDYSAGRLEHKLLQMQGGGLVTREMANTVFDAVASASKRITLPPDLIRRSPNISAHKQQLLYDTLTRYFTSKPQKAAEWLVPKHPGKDGDYASYKAILKICHRIILRHRPESGFHRFAALLALWWMQGRPLPLIVENQLNKAPPEDDRERRRTVRRTLKLVEREVRFQCVRLFSCYSVVLRQVLGDIGRHDLVMKIPDLPLFLEVGASDQTTISLMAIGLSRVVAAKIAIHAPSSDLNVEMARNWLRLQPIDSLGLSQGLQAEVRQLLALLDERSP